MDTQTSAPQQTPVQNPPPAKPASNRTLVFVLAGLVAVLLLAGLVVLALPALLNLLNPTVIPAAGSPTPTVTNAADTVTVHGRIYYSGISGSDTPLLRGLNSTYQLTNLSDSSRTLDDVTVDGYFLKDNNVNLSQYEGKCVSLTAQRLAAWANINTDDTYSRLALEPVSVTPANDCAPYSGDGAPDLTAAPNAHNFTLSGTLHVGVPYAPDSGYDYYLTLDTPREDNENASGLTQYVTEQPVMPLTPAVFDKFVQYQGRHVQITGFLAWGYAESTFIYVQTIQQQ